MGEFDTIRPYNDSEVPAVLERLFSDKAFLDILTHFRFPRFAGALGWLLKPMIARKLRREFAGVTTVATLQDKVEYYVDHTIDRATDGVTYTGVEQLKSGHRLRLFGQPSRYRDGPGLPSTTPCTTPACRHRVSPSATTCCKSRLSAT